MSAPAADQAADAILRGFDCYASEFSALTLRARSHFEAQAWRTAQADAVRRLELYDVVVRDVLADLRGPATCDAGPSLWGAVKAAYRDRIASRHGAEVAETFFNSVTRRRFGTVGVDPDLEFLDRRPTACAVGHAAPVTRTFARRAGIAPLVSRLFESYWFTPGYEDFAGDVARVAGALTRQAPDLDSIEMASAVFFRNKGAYLVGRLRRRHARVPIVIALLNETGRVAVDAVLTTEDEASIVFSYTRSYFSVDAICPAELVRFLHSLMPRKPLAELYIAIGYHRHGKTEMYRALVHHLQTSHDRFEYAPGARGMVMLAFGMPSYDVIFKVVRDRFDAPKTCTRQDVLDKYDLVFKHDRAGRLIDAQPFEHLRFDRDRFAPALLDDLLATASASVALDGDTVVLRHAYTERRVTPLDLYLASASPEGARAAVLDYGQALRDLAATNIFPGDLLLKNFGVTRHGRLVFYDYDELTLLTDCRFRRLPVPSSEDEELAGEPWFYVGERDIFPEEFLPFLGFDPAARATFLAAHADLLTPQYWTGMQEAIRAGAVIDLFPYGADRRLR